MNKSKLLELAKYHHIFNASLSNVEIVRDIQLAAGNSDCFARDDDECHQIECLWRTDCLYELSLGHSDKAFPAIPCNILQVLAVTIK